MYNNITLTIIQVNIDKNLKVLLLSYTSTKLFQSKRNLLIKCNYSQFIHDSFLLSSNYMIEIQQNTISLRIIHIYHCIVNIYQINITSNSNHKQIYKVKFTLFITFLKTISKCRITFRLQFQYPSQQSQQIPQRQLRHESQQLNRQKWHPSPTIKLSSSHYQSSATILSPQIEQHKQSIFFCNQFYMIDNRVQQYHNLSKMFNILLSNFNNLYSAIQAISHIIRQLHKQNLHKLVYIFFYLKGNTQKRILNIYYFDNLCKYLLVNTNINKCYCNHHYHLYYHHIPPRRIHKDLQRLIHLHIYFDNSNSQEQIQGINSLSSCWLYNYKRNNQFYRNTYNFCTHPYPWVIHSKHCPFIHFVHGGQHQYLRLKHPSQQILFSSLHSSSPVIIPSPQISGQGILGLITTQTINRTLKLTIIAQVMKECIIIFTLFIFFDQEISTNWLTSSRHQFQSSITITACNSMPNKLIIMTQLITLGESGIFCNWTIYNMIIKYTCTNITQFILTRCTNTFQPFQYSIQSNITCQTAINCGSKAQEQPEYKSCILQSPSISIKNKSRTVVQVVQKVRILNLQFQIQVQHYIQNKNANLKCNSASFYIDSVNSSLAVLVMVPELHIHNDNPYIKQLQATHVPRMFYFMNSKIINNVRALSKSKRYILKSLNSLKKFSDLNRRLCLCTIQHQSHLQKLINLILIAIIICITFIVVPMDNYQMNQVEKSNQNLYTLKMQYAFNQAVTIILRSSYQYVFGQLVQTRPKLDCYTQIEHLLEAAKQYFQNNFEGNRMRTLQNFRCFYTQYQSLVNRKKEITL
ncbi:unnamed protein product (macronuclear) [Paramecium tetraurelia]|uniref:Transmembrane protein n=1 Tax=Paramecium tetraurelia TaxID=5888 RepID=A0E6P5_PARTE|nr:uncharacterized protein GSPATT00003827001 [Paramecium tetraurelia]CAK90962.1 unnamed protein product [Paramecium tetraurelia]|eukprot:XP_001458359.1 hypothetical protein (macronuclear) [Paramecium tetraurelia strain d4-2]